MVYFCQAYTDNGHTYLGKNRMKTNSETIMIIFGFLYVNRTFTRVYLGDNGKLKKGGESFPIKLQFDGERTSLDYVAREVRRQASLENQQIIMSKNMQVLRAVEATTGNNQPWIYLIICPQL